jgi:hypothetical protein
MSIPSVTSDISTLKLIGLLVLLWLACGLLAVIMRPILIKLRLSEGHVFVGGSMVSLTLFFCSVLLLLHRQILHIVQRFPIASAVVLTLITVGIGVLAYFVRRHFLFYYALSALLAGGFSTLVAAFKLSDPKSALAGLAGLVAGGYAIAKGLQDLVDAKNDPETWDYGYLKDKRDQSS